MINNVSGVILAGGTGKRFNGVVKSKISIGGKSIISRIIDTMDSLFKEIIIVTNSPEEYAEYDRCELVTDTFTGKGPLGGIHAAMNISENDALFVIGGDMPFIDRDLIKRQSEYYLANRCDVLIPFVDGLTEPLHSIYSCSVFKILDSYLGSSDQYSIRGFIKLTDHKYFTIDSSKEVLKAFTNINSPEDLELVNRLYGLK